MEIQNVRKDDVGTDSRDNVCRVFICVMFFFSHDGASNELGRVRGKLGVEAVARDDCGCGCFALWQADRNLGEAELGAHEVAGGLGYGVLIVEMVWHRAFVREVSGLIVSAAPTASEGSEDRALGRRSLRGGLRA